MSKFRSLASQSCAIFPYICLQFVHGSVVGFQTILIAELHKKDSEIPTTIDQLSWFATLDIVKLVGSLVTGIFMHRLGSTLIALMTASIFVTSFLLYYFSTAVTILFTSRVLNSLVSVHPLSGPYISEISEPRYRGRFLATGELAVTAGSFFSLLLGSLMNWRTVALVNVSVPILAAISVLAIPNSPTWLASKGRLDEAEKALCWLRGWVEPKQVHDEFRALVRNIEKSVSTEHEGDVEAIGCQKRSKRFFETFHQRLFYVPLGTLCLIFLLYSFSGVDTFENYGTVVFRELKSPIEESQATAIMGAMGIIGNMILLLVLRRTGKRKLVLLSVVVTGTCHAIVSIIGLSELKGNYLWIPPIAVIISFFANASGIGTIVYMIIGEFFPPSVRYIASSIGISVKFILKSIMNKLYLYAVDALTLPGVFMFFAIVNLVALITYYFLFPETEGRSLEEIEDHFKKDKSTKEDKK